MTQNDIIEAPTYIIIIIMLTESVSTTVDLIAVLRVSFFGEFSPGVSLDISQFQVFILSAGMT